jgi:GNAT superfamily N-acetyltransferase
LLEVQVPFGGQTETYYYPVDFAYLFSPAWRRDNLSSTAGQLRWFVEMDTALRLGLLPDYRNQRLSRRWLNQPGWVLEVERGNGCRYMTLSIIYEQALWVHALLMRAQRTGTLESFTGDGRQVELALAAGIGNLQILGWFLRAVTDHDGQSWARTLNMIQLRLSVSRFGGFYDEMVGFSQASGIPLSVLHEKLRGKAPLEGFRELQRRLAEVECITRKYASRYPLWPVSFFKFLGRQYVLEVEGFTTMQSVKHILAYVRVKFERIVQLFSCDKRAWPFLVKNFGPRAGIIRVFMFGLALDGGSGSRWGRETLFRSVPDGDDCREPYDRQNRRRGWTPHPNGELVSQPVLDPEAALMHREAGEQARQALGTAFDGLSPQVQLVLSAIYFEDRSLVEVARELGMRESEVLAIEQDALAQLRQKISN